MGYAGTQSVGFGADDTLAHAARDARDLAYARRPAARNSFRDVLATFVDDAGINRAAVEADVLSIIRERRERAAFFPQRLFADPAWEILLALTLAQARQHRLDVTKLCQRVDVPATTVLRWISTMLDEGILLRLNDNTDRRRKYIELSPESWSKMSQYISAISAPRLRAA
jgi:hypothetical protein